MFEIKLCRTKAAVSVKPKRSMRLDTGKLKGRFTVIAATPIAAVIKVGQEEVVCHQYGEIFFKSLRDEQAIRKIAQEIYETAA